MSKKQNLRVYGIKNCDTMKKTFNWLNEHEIDFVFVNYREQEISLPQINEWLKKLKPEELINTKSATFKALNEEQQKGMNSKKLAARLAFANPTMIKRPLLETEHEIFLGFKPEVWEDLFYNKKHPAK